MEGNKQTNMGSQSETKEKVKQAASDVQAKAASMAGEAKQQVSEEARSTLSNQKAEAVHELHGVAEALRMTGSQLREQDQTMVAQYSNKIADQVDRVSGYLEARSLDEVIHEAKAFARRQPEIFLGGAFTIGLLATRFLKSSSPTHYEGQMGYSGGGRTGPQATSPSYTGRYTGNPETRQRVTSQSWGET